MSRRAPRTRPLCLALLAALASSGVPTSAAPPQDTSWIRLRHDVTRRIFPQLPAARSAPGAIGTPHATHVVANCNDAGPGSLREAVAAAASGDTIDLGGLQCSTITLLTGAIEVELDDLAIIGPGARDLAIDGRRADRLFVHPRGGTLRFKGLTLRNGSARAEGFDVSGGGCIASAGYLQLYNSLVRDCFASGIGSYGGALYAYSLTLGNTTLVGNHAYGTHAAAGTAAFGGAAFVYALQMDTSTVSHNLADHRINPGFSSYDTGGGIVAVSGGTIHGSTIDSNISDGRAGGIASFNPLVVINSTLSGNLARHDIAGGVFVRWPAALQLENSTVTRNHAALDGGGVWINAAGSNFRSSIVFGNSSDVGNRDNRYGLLPQAITIGGERNVLATLSPLLTGPADTLALDPQLRPLALNGGSTRTHALAATSPVIDAGSNPLGLTSDQRGGSHLRSWGNAPDIGAFEWQGRADLGATTAVPASSRGTLLLLVATLLAAVGWRRRRLH
ncbi:MAG: hypothetical protein F9K31_11380 [Dokdonella sp.]|nr:MAG: hypothetical protein F9K31_11380 [Dokdonella sp.]